MSDLEESSVSDDRRNPGVSDEESLLESGLRIAYDDNDAGGPGAELAGPLEHRQTGPEAAAADGGTSILQTLRKLTDAPIHKVHLREVGAIGSPIHLPRGGRVGANLPTQLGRYRIAGEIARGGVGMVYRARDEDLGRDVAIKVLHDEYSEDSQMTCRFVEEAQVGGQLQHPGIVPVHELGLVAGRRPYFAMKLVKGETLSRLLERRAHPSEERLRFLGIFEQICQPVAYAHARGVIHRDLKPSNIMVGAFGEVQVMDWGLAKVLACGGVADERAGTRARPEASVIETVRSGSTGSESLAGSVLGTLAYMPPEQARGEVDTVDESSDVFGLGAILCEILTGEPPYTGDTIREIRYRAERGEIHEALERLKTCGADEQVIALARRCLSLNPRERPRDGGAVAEEISSYLQSLEAKARASQIQAARAEFQTREERKARRLTVALAAAVTVSLLAAGGGYWWVERQQRAAIREASTRVRVALGDARRLHAGALSSGTGREEWTAALEAVKAARNLVTDDIDPDLRREVEDFGLEVERERRVRQLASRLETIRDEPTFVQFGTPSFGIDQHYADAFREFLGAQILDLERGEVARRLRESGIERDISLALDDWASVRRRLDRSWERIVEIALAIEPDPSPQRMWDFVRGEGVGDLDALVETLATGDVGARYLCTLAQFRASDGETDETLLRRAVKVEPDSYRANALYGSSLRSAHRFAESLPYLAAARALRPRNALVAYNLGVVNARLGNVDAAFECFSRSFGVLPHSWVLQEPLELLEDPGVDLSEAALDEYIRAIRDVPDEQKRVVRRIWELLGAALARRYGPDESERAIAIAMREVERTGRRNPHVLGMLARVQFAVGKRAAAVRTLEEAVSLPAASWMYGQPDRDLLGKYRRAVYPEIVSYASLDAVLETQQVEDVRAALEGRKVPGYLAYLDGRRLQRSGDHAAAAERFPEVLEMDRGDPEPFVRLWECLSATADTRAAARAIRQEIAKGAPTTLIPIPPEKPVSLRAIPSKAGVRLETSELRCADPRVGHASTRWEIRSRRAGRRRQPRGFQSLGCNKCFVRRGPQRGTRGGAGRSSHRRAEIRSPTPNPHAHLSAIVCMSVGPSELISTRIGVAPAGAAMTSAVERREEMRARRRLPPVSGDGPTRDPERKSFRSRSSPSEGAAASRPSSSMGPGCNEVLEFTGMAAVAFGFRVRNACRSRERAPSEPRNCRISACIRALTSCILRSWWLRPSATGFRAPRSHL